MLFDVIDTALPIIAIVVTVVFAIRAEAANRKATKIQEEMIYISKVAFEYEKEKGSRAYINIFFEADRYYIDWFDSYEFGVMLTNQSAASLFVRNVSVKSHTDPIAEKELNKVVGVGEHRILIRLPRSKLPKKTEGKTVNAEVGYCIGKDFYSLSTEERIPDRW